MANTATIAAISLASGFAVRLRNDHGASETRFEELGDRFVALATVQRWLRVRARPTVVEPNKQPVDRTNRPQRLRAMRRRKCAGRLRNFQSAARGPRRALVVS
jgi:hypothetical protein